MSSHLRREVAISLSRSRRPRRPGRGHVFVVLVLGLLGCGGDASTGAGAGGAGGTPIQGCRGEDVPAVPVPNSHVCSNLVHRVAHAACPPYAPGSAVIGRGGPADECVRDADCTRRPLGVCINDTGIGGHQGNRCDYGCESDDDCGRGSICDCEATRGTCLSAMCRTDADCGAGLLCVEARAGEYGANGFRAPPIYVCQSASDECVESADCPADEMCFFSIDHLACRDRGPIP
jgi:hypothetical protein